MLLLPTYSCAMLLLPIVSAVFTLSLAAAQQTSSPQFMTEPSNTTAYQTAVLYCSASGNPTPSISWFRDGSPLNLAADSRLSQTAEGLGITDLQESNGRELEGVYHCEASSVVGRIRSRGARLTRTVWIVGFNERPLEEKTVTRYSPLTLPCQVPQQSIPPSQVIWNVITPQSERSGTALNGSLIFSFFESSQSHVLISCRLSNPVSGQNIESSRYLLRDNPAGAMLIHPTRIVVPPTPQTVVAGESVTLQCFTTGRPIASIAWSKDGSAVVPGGHVQTAEEARHLVISGVMVDDAGRYTCTASARDTVSASALLQVIVPPTINSSFPEIMANVSQSLSISCSSVGTPPLLWSWQYNGRDLMPSEQVTIRREGASSTLEMSSLLEEDSGVYQCHVHQPATGRQAAHNQLINVRVIPPMFVNVSSTPDVLALSGSTLTVPCMATGFPSPTFTWEYAANQQPVPLNSRISIPAPGTGDGTLTISQAATTDSTTYTCIATNSPNAQPIRSDPFIVRVIDMPRVEPLPQSLIPSPGEAVTLNCVATVPNSVTLHYRWTRDNVIVGSEERVSGSLSIPSVREDQSDNGVYRCLLVLSRNGLNAPPLVIPVNYTTTLTVGEPPMPPCSPTPLSPSQVGTSSFTARWDLPSCDGGLALQNYTLQIINRGASHCSSPEQQEWTTIQTGLNPAMVQHTITMLHPATTYQFRVEVFTILFSNISTPYSVLTRPSVPQAPPINIAITNTSSGGLLVSWDPPPNCSTHGGRLTGYTIEYRVSGSATSSRKEVSSSSTQNAPPTQDTLSDLIPNTLYHISVAAKTNEGEGPFSNAFTVTSPSTPSITTSSSTGNVTTEPSVTVPVTSQPWFYAVVAVGAVLVLLAVLLVFCCICCKFCGRTGHYKFGSKQESSEGVTRASRNSRKKKNKNTIMPHVVVHSSPPPASRTTDYAMPHLHSTSSSRLINGHIPSTAPPSTGPSTTNLTSSAMSSPQFSARNLMYAHSNGNLVENNTPQELFHSNQHIQHGRLHRQHFQDDPRQRFQDAPVQNRHYQDHQLINGHHHTDSLRFQPYRDGTPTLPDFAYEGEEDNCTPENHMTQAEHVRQVSASTTQKFVDTLSRVHTPPLVKQSQDPQGPNFGSSYLARTVSPVEPPWNPGEFLNVRGHMSNRHQHVVNDPVARSDSFRSTESTSSMEFRGPSQLMDQQGGGQLPPLHEQRQLVQEREDLAHPHRSNGGNLNQSYLTRADEIQMDELKRSRKEHLERGRGRHPSLQATYKEDLSVGGYDSTDDFDLGGHTGGLEGVQAYSSSIVESYGPKVHMSRSIAVHHNQGNFTPDPTYDVPPSRLAQQQQQQKQEEVIYHYPPPPYAAPPPPHSGRSSLSPPQHVSPSSHSFGSQHAGTERRLQVFPMVNTASVDPTSPPHTYHEPPNIIDKAAMTGTRMELIDSHTPISVNGIGTRTDNHVPSSNSDVPSSSNKARIEMEHSSNSVASIPINRTGAGNRMEHNSNTRRLYVVPMDPPTASVPPPPPPPPPQQTRERSPLSSNSLQNSLDGSIGSEWSLDKIQRSMEQTAQNFENMLTPPQEAIEEDWQHKHNTALTNGYQIPSPLARRALQPPTPTQNDTSVPSQYKPPTSSKLPPGLVHAKPPTVKKTIASKYNPSTTTALSSDLINSKPSYIQNPKPLTQQHKPPTFSKPKIASKPQVLPKPHPLKTRSPPPDVIPSGSSNGYCSDEDPDSIAINKKRPKVPDLTTMDPRKPRLKKKKVPGSVWQPHPMNRAIQSSSESDSDGSIDSVLPMPGDSSTLRSVHV